MGDQDGGDCSDRRCPYQVAWSAGPDKTGNIHTYAECAGVGICDRGSGTAIASRATRDAAAPTCPNDCSGHGECVYAEDVTFGTVYGDYNDAGIGVGAVKIPQKPNWDSGKVRMCVCDPGYTDIDCSRRMCPKGNDVGRAFGPGQIAQNVPDAGSGAHWRRRARRRRRRTTTRVPSAELLEQPPRHPASDACFADLVGRSFALTFTSQLNQSSVDEAHRHREDQRPDRQHRHRDGAPPKRRRARP